MKRILLEIALVLLVIGGIAGGLVALARFRPHAEPLAVEALPPLVRTIEVVPETLPVTVQSQGTVSARTETQLVAEVSGRVLSVSESLRDGGFFEPDEVLATIDPIDYQLAVERAEGEVARSERLLAWEEAEAESARDEWAQMGEGEPPPLVVRLPQLAEARAHLKAAQAALKQAERDLERTRVVAPYAGRVRDQSIDRGQYVARGAVLAHIYAVDAAEVRLPLRDEDLPHIDLPVDYRGANGGAAGPTVTLSATFAGREFHWHGTIVRTEGEFDARTRQLHAIAQIDDPYGRRADPDQPPLAVGMFITATIEGRSYPDVVALPRAALRGESEVVVVDGDNRLRRRRIGVLRRAREEVLVRGGLERGERVCVSPLEVFVDGMQVRRAEAADRGSRP